MKQAKLKKVWRSEMILICPHCEKEIGEKESLVKHWGSDNEVWTHRKCGGEYVMPPTSAQKLKEVEELEKYLAAAGIEVVNKQIRKTDLAKAIMAASNEWKSLGVKLEHHQSTEYVLEVYAMLGGKPIGYAVFSTEPNSFSCGGVEVEPAYRRYGIASEMYKYAEKLTGRKLAPSGGRTADGKDLWNQKDREFGETVAAVVSPRVNLNGTAKQELINQLIEFKEALGLSLEKLREAEPNGRDYQGDAALLKEATAQHKQRLKTLENMVGEINEQILEIDIQVN